MSAAEIRTLETWQAWLDQHRDDPELIAGCARLGKILAGDQVGS